jgi:CheY-like chemotaxis protein
VAKILVVDDDVTVTQLLKMLLTMEGHQPTALNDSTQTLDVVGLLQPDLITLDLMMPGLTGFEVCELLHQHPTFSSIPILIISARDDTESMERAFQAGATAYLAKPFGVDSLTEKIKELTSP